MKAERGDKNRTLGLETAAEVARLKDLSFQYIVFGKLSTPFWPPGVLGGDNATHTYSGSSADIPLCLRVIYFYFCSW